MFSTLEDIAVQHKCYKLKINLDLHHDLIIYDLYLSICLVEWKILSMLHVELKDNKIMALATNL